MAAWNKDELIFTLKDPDTGGYDNTLRTVEVYPMTSAYPTGKVSCTQLASLHDYKPVSNLDDNTHYWVRWTVGVTVHEKPLWAKNSYPPIGE